MTPLGLLAALAALTLTSVAQASEYVSIKGAKAAGPSAYDRVFVDKHGPKRAETVVVLIPGTSGGSGSLDPIARDLVDNVEDLQVWNFDRRTQPFEDTSAFESGDAQAAADYYLGFQYERVTADQVPFVSEWGFATELNDLHEVIERASRGGRTVILGGHSRGASSAVAYAAWDFPRDGAGYRDLDGLILIDGGLAAFGPEQFSLEEAQARLDEIRGGDVFNDALGAGIPEIGQIFLEVAARFAVEQPDAPSSLQSNPLIAGAGLSPPYPVTNEGFLGYLFDKTYSPLGPSLQIRAGDFGPGEPRPWASGENTPIETFAGAFANEPGNATEWYYPNRMILDTSAANALRRTPAADLLGLRLFHTRRIDTPLLAYQTDLTGGGVLEGARTLIDRSRIERAKLIDASATTSHLDPVLAPIETNRLTRAAVRFVRRASR